MDDAIEPVEIFLPWVKVNCPELLENLPMPELPADIIIKLRYYICKSDSAELGYWTDVMNNPDPELTDLIIKNYKGWKQRLIVNNTNPKLADLIIKQGVKYNNPNKGLTDYILNSKKVNYFDLSSNSNELLTDYIIAHKDDLNRNELLSNTNPALVPLMFENVESLDMEEWEIISSNPNPGLTDIIINNPGKVNYFELSNNTNKKLIPFMYENRHKLDHDNATMKI